MAMSKVTEMKVIALFVLLVSTLIFGLFPLFIHKRLEKKGEGSKTKLALSGLMCLGGGVLLSICFMHMLPEVQEGIDNAVKRGELKPLPFSIASLSVCVGFFLVYLIEEVAFTLCKAKNNENEKEDLELQTEKKNGALTTLEENEGFLESHENKNATDVPDHKPQESTRSAVSALRNFLLLLALAFHSIVEGLAIGLQNTEEEVWIMAGAVAAHKLVIVFCFSIELLESKTSHILHLIYIIGFSLISPVGISIGIGIHEYMDQAGNLDSPVMHVLQGVAAGTLIYITFFEVLNKERAKPGNGLAKVILVLIGFIIMTVISSVLHD